MASSRKTSLPPFWPKAISHPPKAPAEIAMKTLEELIIDADREMGANPLTPAPKHPPLRVKFLFNLDGPGRSKGDYVFLKGEEYTDPNGFAFIRRGVALPADDAAKAYCQSVGFTDEKIMTAYKHYAKTMEGRMLPPDILAELDRG
jgi:hypothetical protein